MNKYDVEHLAHRFFGVAYDHQRAGRLGYALQDYRRSLELHPTPEAYTFLGRTLGLLGRYDEAITECQEAIALDPDFGPPYNDIGCYLCEQDEWEKAQVWFELALNAPRYEHRAHAYFHLGRMFQYLGRFHDALEAYRSALQHDPAYQQALQALMHLRCLMN